MTAILNPVALITGAASSLGEACAKALAAKASGGLILADADETGLALTADGLTAPPERVSTLAFDPADAARWREATDFIEAHYGRLDWALIQADLDAMSVSLRALMPLMRANSGGASIVLLGAGEDLGSESDEVTLLRIVRVAAKEGAPDKVRVNAVAFTYGDMGPWAVAPSFADLVREQGDARGALARLTRLVPPLARYRHADNVTEPVLMLLGEIAPVSGVALVAEGLLAL